MMALSSAYTKTTSSWAVGSGNGALDTGTIANNTWYHVWLIERTDTGVVDVLVSASASSPAMPTNYTLKRRIGSMKTDASAQWVAFVQDGDLYQWVAPVTDISATNPGTSAVTRTLGSVPTGVQVQAFLQLVLANSGAGGSSVGYLSDLATNDMAPSSSFGDTPPAATPGSNVLQTGGRLYVRTNTLAQIRSRISFSDASVTLNINTLGWIDRRGRDS
jgi:hypothetical protein